MRLKDWDYRSTGYYFVTMNTKDREPYFGGITGDKMVLSDTGIIAEQELLKTSNLRENVSIDEYIIMPDHLHVIFEITCNFCGSVSFSSGGVARYAPTDNGPAGMMSSISPKPGSLSAIVRSYKSAVTKRCREAGHTGFAWQSRFYDRIIRDHEELFNVREYIRNNVLK